MFKITFTFLLFFILAEALPQAFLPIDYLDKQFYRERREALRKIMPDNSVTVVFSYPERVFSKDVNYAYHPNPDLYYFSGYKEPDAVLLIFKENQQVGDKNYNELFYVRKRNPLQEQWTGRRLGVEGVKNDLGFSYVENAEEFKNLPLDLLKFSKIIFDVLPDDIGAGSLLDLVNVFKQKAGIVKGDNKFVLAAYNTIQRSTPSTLPYRVGRLKINMQEVNDSVYKTNPILLELINHPDSATLVSVIKKIKNQFFSSLEYAQLTSSLREIKTQEELSLLRRSVYISAIAHAEVMKAIQPKMSETELSGIFHFIHKKYGAEDEGYPPIVGAGANGCILHYIENSATEIRNQLVLMDVGSEYHGYSADVTRTVPANGKFSPEQRAIYELVYAAQEEVFKLCKDGTHFPALNEKATEVLATGLLRLGIIATRQEVSRYYIHGCSHHLGLDVHDKSMYGDLKENMVITVEPGIYIPKGSPCDPKWWDVAVRIEDDVVIGNNNAEILSAAAPRKVEEIEKLMAEKSVLNELVLPELK